MDKVVEQEVILHLKIIHLLSQAEVVHHPFQEGAADIQKEILTPENFPKVEGILIQEEVDARGT